MTKSIIQEDLTVEGDIKANGGELAIKGKVKGDISAKMVEVLEGCEVEGALKAESVVVEGRLSGSVDCGDLTLRGTSDVRAEVNAKTMIAEKGGKLVGQMKITG